MENDIIEIKLTKAEAWAVLTSLAEASRYEATRADKLEQQMRTWIAERILREVGPQGVVA